MTTSKKKTKSVDRDWQCMECGKQMTLKQAERASFGSGCPKCGGGDIDMTSTGVESYAKEVLAS